MERTFVSNKTGITYTILPCIHKGQIPITKDNIGMFILKSMTITIGSITTNRVICECEVNKEIHAEDKEWYSIWNKLSQ